MAKTRNKLIEAQEALKKAQADYENKKGPETLAAKQQAAAAVEDARFNRVKTNKDQ